MVLCVYKCYPTELGPSQHGFLILSRLPQVCPQCCAGAGSPTWCGDLSSLSVDLWSDGVPTGVYTVLYLYIAYTLGQYFRYARVCPRSLQFYIAVRGLRIRQQATVFLAMTALYLVATTHLVADWVYVERGFVYHGQTEDTMMDYLLVNPPNWMFVSTASFLVNTLFADCFLVRTTRVGALWNS